MSQQSHEKSPDKSWTEDSDIEDADPRVHGGQLLRIFTVIDNCSQANTHGNYRTDHQQNMKQFSNVLIIVAGVVKWIRHDAHNQAKEKSRNKQYGVPWSNINGIIDIIEQWTIGTHEWYAQLVYLQAKGWVFQFGLGMNPFVEKISPVHQMQTKTVDTMADIIAKIPNDDDQAKVSSRSRASSCEDWIDVSWGGWGVLFPSIAKELLHSLFISLSSSLHSFNSLS